jgi:outer membrane receptor protein involved in Fe transport
MFPIAVSLVSGTSAEEPNVLTYPAAFFVQGDPDTAFDMIDRLPGFVFNEGNTARGFAGTGGNVLIDGQRPTSKTDDLESVLTRIPASDVERIELIRGGAPGINMQGQTAIANIIRKKADATQVVADLEDTIFLDGHTVPKASLEYTRQAGASTYEGSITRYGDYDDTVGTGTRALTDVQNGTTTVQPAQDNGVGAGFGLTGAATVPLFAGELKANLTLQDTPFHSAIFYEPPGVPEAIRNASGDQNGELGLHWKGMLGGLEVESVLLQRLSQLSDLNTLQAPNDSERFSSSSNTGESIARETIRFSPLEALTFEAGGEAAYNFLDGTSSFVQNGVDVPLPTPNPHVAEHRSEIFAQEAWKIAPDWLLEAGARFEFSTITETGEFNLSRSFFYPKPRLVLTWTPDADTQVHARFEKVVGQLDFDNFIASSNLAGPGVTAGNARLRPDQHSQYEISYEQHFLEDGAAVITFMHEQIDDVVDLVPVKDAEGIVFDAPGNIGSGTNEKLDLTLTLPLDSMGLENGVLESVNSFQWSRVRDPVTGRARIISEQRPQDIQFKIRQDIESLNSTWSISYENGWDEWYYRVSQVQHRRLVPPYVTASWEWKPEPSLSLHFEIANIGRFVSDDQFFNHIGSRADTDLSDIEEIRIKSQPRFYVQIRKTFG